MTSKPKSRKKKDTNASDELDSAREKAFRHLMPMVCQLAKENILPTSVRRQAIAEALIAASSPVFAKLYHLPVEASVEIGIAASDAAHDCASKMAGPDN